MSKSVGSYLPSYHDFELKYVSLTNIKQVLKENAEKYGDKKGITNEMLQLLDIYNSIKNNED